MAARLLGGWLLVVALSGCGGSEPSRSAASAAVLRAEVLESHQQAIAEHERLIEKRDAHEQITQDGITDLTRLAERSAADPEFVRKIQGDIAALEESNREFREEIDAKIAAKAELVEARKAAVDAAE